MKHFNIILLIILAASCSSRIDTIEIPKEFPIQIDSTSFVRNLEYERIGYQVLPDSWREKLQIDRISEKHGEEYLFRIFNAGSIDVGKDFSTSFIYLARNNKVPVDAYWENYYLVTMDANEEPISIIETASYIAQPGQVIEKSCTITPELKISIKEVELTEDWGSGETKESSKTQRFEIKEKGEILPVANK